MYLHHFTVFDISSGEVNVWLYAAAACFSNSLTQQWASQQKMHVVLSNIVQSYTTYSLASHFPEAHSQAYILNMYYSGSGAARWSN